MDTGAKLREAREAKGLTLEDIQQRTKIQKRYLIAIEENNHSVMPGDFYARAFIKEYAQIVGVNPDEVLATRQEQPEVASNTTEKQEQPEQESRRQRSRETAERPRRERRPIPYLGSIIVGVIVLAAIAAAFFIYANSGNDTSSNEQTAPSDNGDEITQSETGSEDETSQTEDEASGDTNTEDSAADNNSDQEADDAQQEEEEQEAAEPELNLEEEGSAANSQTTTYTLTNPGDEVTLEIAADGGDVWYSVTDGNGQQLDTATLPDGSDPAELDISDADEVTVRAGFSQGAVITVNGQEASFPAPDTGAQNMHIVIEK